MKGSAALEASLQQRAAQLPRLTARLLKLNRVQLAMELARTAERNPLLEVDQAALPAIAGDRTTSLRSHLLDQIAGIADETLRLDARAVAGEADADGRIPDAAALRRLLGLSAGRISAAVRKVQALDPAGVGACDLRECLLLQLAALPARDDVAAAETIVRDHFAQLGRRRYDLLPQPRLQPALRLIASLNPRPGAGFAAAAAPAAPEIRVYKQGGMWRVEPIDGEVAVSAVSAAGGSRQFRQLARQARTLVEGLEFRRRTLLAVATAAVARQRMYCERGAAFLLPLGLKQVAEDTGLAVSTVSTTVAGKLLQGPHGVIALKYLFQRPTRGRIGFSAAALQMAIRQAVAGEDPVRPLSDAAIASRLAADGGAPARRTVAKHRAAAGIAAASLRKRPLDPGESSP